MAERDGSNDLIVMPQPYIDVETRLKEISTGNLRFENVATVHAVTL